MKYLIFPKGYDPMVASGPPTADILKLGITWTEEQTKAALILEGQAVVSDCKPGLWICYEEISDEEAAKYLTRSS